ncbi:MAG TPA: AmmeMemoRadiSam system protein B [Methanothermobacter sp.]|nr:MEMO1 family protein Mfer_0894 [Methanothermobacter sp. MT-2]HHW04373.1 AmmeMemoRadiSam system protein B [Methanothermobacter sp.]HOK72415.1 AmmeMemoRadiSam system protein B [Methanothermobacter sp.]HOL69182.1 AmmeMemoRadiSam system protein B [Methanothermobacter sp.]HPQ03902.1 AmmeMemoRadiSam system protein B [Methanothermobacter sp.]
MKRNPAVAGTFYEADPEALKKRIEWCFHHEIGPGKIPRIGDKRELKAVIAPHAGYIYSGPVAAHTYHEVAADGFPETFILLCPNHTGIGSGVSMMTKGEWVTPIGSVKIDEDLAEELLEVSEIIDIDESAHLGEHSCEVHIPFLQYFSQDFKIVPVCMWMQDLDTAKEIGNSIADASQGKDILIIASTDFTHYEPADVAYKNDQKVLEAIVSLDENRMYERIYQFNVSMCGYGPVAASIVAARKKGASKGKLLKYATSGDITGDYSSVVGYASAIFK